MILGLLAGLATGAIWGLSFVAPRAVAPLTAIDLTIARYGLFGLSALVLIAAYPRFRPLLGGRRLAAGLVLGAIGYTGYFVAIAAAVGLAGAAIPPLVVGLLPVVLALIGNWRERSVRWRALALPLALVGAGILTVNLATLRQAPPGADRAAILAGLACALAALLIWTGYAVANARIMRAPDAPDALAWTGLQGVGAALAVLPLLALCLVAPGLGLSAVPRLGTGALAAPAFVAWTLVLALAGGWIATWCWAVAARRLPLALSAQAIVAETLSALLYGFAWEGRWPDAAEGIGALLQIVGVAAAVAVFSRPAPLHSREALA